MRQTLGAIAAAFLLVAGLVASTSALGDPSRPGCGLSNPGSCDVRNLYRAVESAPVTDDYEARALMLLALGQVRSVDSQAFASLDRVYRGANTDTAPCIRNVLLETIDENASVFTTVGDAGYSWDQAVAAASSSDFVEARNNYLSVAQSKIGGSADVLLDGSYAARVNNLKKCSTIRSAPLLASPTPRPRILAVPKPAQDLSTPAPANPTASAPAAPTAPAVAAAASAGAELQAAPKTKPSAVALAKPSPPSVEAKAAPNPIRPNPSRPAAPEQATVHRMPNAPPSSGHQNHFAAPPPMASSNRAPGKAKQQKNPKLSVHPKNAKPKQEAKAKKPKPKKVSPSKTKKPKVDKASPNKSKGQKPGVASKPKTKKPSPAQKNSSKGTKKSANSEKNKQNSSDSSKKSKKAKATEAKKPKNANKPPGKKNR